LCVVHMMCARFAYPREQSLYFWISSALCLAPDPIEIPIGSFFVSFLSQSNFGLKEKSFVLCLSVFSVRSLILASRLSVWLSLCLIRSELDWLFSKFAGAKKRNRKFLSSFFHSPILGSKTSLCLFSLSVCSLCFCLVVLSVCLSKIGTRFSNNLQLPEESNF
jgi:hypothetical protein